MYRTFGLAIAVSLLMASLASAQPEAGTIPEHESMRLHQKLPDRLGLSDQQKDQMRKLRLGLQKDMTQLHAKIRIERLDLQELFTAEKLDRGAIEKKVSAISDLQHSVKMKMLDHMFAVNALLTPEQQKIWKEHMGRFDARPMGPMHRGGSRRQMFGEGMPGMDQQPGDDIQEMPGDGMN
jgi:Spy/CpxP family protein refolding chaperone